MQLFAQNHLHGLSSARKLQSKAVNILHFGDNGLLNEVLTLLSGLTLLSEHTVKSLI